MPGPTRVIGGYKIYGGWIRQADAGAVMQATAPFDFTGYPERRIPIRQCRFIEDFIERPLHIAGLLGKSTTRRVDLKTRFAFTIWYDYDNVIELSIPEGAAGTPSFRQRDPFQLCFLAGYDYNIQQYAKAYYAPRCTAESITPIWDNENKPVKMIGMEVVGISRSYSFILPDEGDPSNTATIVGAYVNYLGKGLV